MSFLQRWFQRGHWEREMSDELRFHIERQTDANVASGMPRDEARRQALLQFGGAEAVKVEGGERRIRHESPIVKAIESAIGAHQRHCKRSQLTDWTPVSTLMRETSSFMYLS